MSLKKLIEYLGRVLSMKKVVLFCFVLLLMLIGISCSDSNRIKKGSVAEYNLKLIMQNAADSPPHMGIIAFAEKLEEISGGTMTIDITLIATINSIKELIEPVLSGETDIVLTGYGYSDLSYKIPELEIFGQSYIFRDYEHFLEWRETEHAQKLRLSLNKIGIFNTKSWYFGVRHTTSNNPINSLANFRGLRLRVPPIDSSVAFAEAMGAIPVPIGFGGFYDALKTKTVHAQENPLSLIESSKIYEVQKYIAMTGHSISLALPIINKKVYDSFSQQQAAWYNEAAEYGRQVCYDITIEEERQLLDKFQNEYGMIVTYPDVEELRSAMKPHYDKLEEKYGKGTVYSIVGM